MRSIRILIVYSALSLLANISIRNRSLVNASPVAEAAPDPQLGILDPILSLIGGGGGGGGGTQNPPALYPVILRIAQTVDPLAGTNLADLVQPGTTLADARGILGPTICSLFNCAVDPIGGPVDGGPDLLPQIAELLDLSLGTRLVEVLQGDISPDDGRGLVGPLVCLLFECTLGPQVTTTTTITSISTFTSTFTTTRTSSCPPTTRPSCPAAYCPPPQTYTTTTTCYETVTNRGTSTVYNYNTITSTRTLPPITTTYTSTKTLPASTVTYTGTKILSASTITYTTTKVLPGTNYTVTKTLPPSTVSYGYTRTIPGYTSTSTYTITKTLSAVTVSSCTTTRPYRQ